MDVTPLIPADRQVIDSYGAGGFHVSGAAYQGAILVFPDATRPWPVAALAEVTTESLAPVVAHGNVQILLLGCGRRMQPVPPELRLALRRSGITIDAMDTGAACRTYNVLLAEDRRVAAALLPAR
ncbi:MAG TPA: Mth938-like domain-containing protein [Stellaceae bacterium]|nr:Mth938-like domain-containing protein [Stellaceae bacterium]